MQIPKGTHLDIDHNRKGVYRAVAFEDFDTDRETWWPLALVTKVEGLSATWDQGDKIPTRGSLVKRFTIVGRPHP